MKILISLISDQQIPNVLFIKEIKPDKNIFVTTDSMEKKKQSDKIINTFNLTNVEKIIVNQESFDDVLEKLKKISLLEGSKLIINITGGTKTMALTAYSYGISRAAEIYYLPIGSKHFIKVYPENYTQEYPKQREIKQILTINEYLNSYLKEDDRNAFNFKKPIKDQSYAQKIFNMYTQGQIDLNILESLRRVRNEKKEKNKKIDFLNNDKNYINLDEVRKLIKSIDFQQEDKNILSKDEITYITGGWFEEWLYYVLKEKLTLSEDYILLGVNTINPQNDFDVIMIRNNKLFVFECKTKIETGTLFSDTIYKSSASLKRLGLSTKPFLVTLSDNLRDENGDFIQSRKERADSLDVIVWDRKILLDEKNFNEELGKIK